MADGDKKKVKKKDLDKEIAVAQTIGVRQAVQWPDITSGLDPVRLATILKSAREGNAEEYLTLAEEIEERDLHYRSVLSTRKQAVEGLVPTVIPASEDKKDLDMAKAVETDILENDDFPDLVKDAMDALGKGYSVHEIMWDTKSTPWKPGRIIFRDPRWFEYDKLTGKTLLMRDGMGTELLPLPERKFIVHEPHLKTGLPIRGGLALPMALYFLIKYYDITAWTAFVDRYGMPIRVGKYGRNATDKDIATLKSAIAHLGEDVGAVIPDSMIIEIIENKSSGNTQLFEKMANWIDKQVSKLVLGQTMTADDGSSRSQAEVHNDVRQDILEADARQLEKTINRHLIKPYIDLNWGPQEKYPRLRIPCPDTDDITAWVENIERLVPLGLTVKADEVRSKLGLSKPDDGDEILKQPETAAPAAPVATALNAEQPQDQSELDLLQEENDYSELTDDIIKAVNKLAEKCKTLDEFHKRLPELLSLWDMEKAADLLTVETWKARALGDTEFAD